MAYESTDTTQQNAHGMKWAIGWSAQNIVIPLIPFGIGALIRLLCGVEGVKEIFDAGELCFSMAMLSMLVIVSASRLSDKALRDMLTAIFIVWVVFFLVLFSFISVQETQIQSANADMLYDLRLKLKNGTPVGAEVLNDPHLEKFRAMLSRVWVWSIVPSILAIGSAIICKLRYKLED